MKYFSLWVVIGCMLLFGYLMNRFKPVEANPNENTPQAIIQRDLAR